MAKKFIFALDEDDFDIEIKGPEVEFWYGPVDSCLLVSSGTVTETSQGLDCVAGAKKDLILRLHGANYKSQVDDEGMVTITSLSPCTSKQGWVLTRIEGDD